ncbi:MAG: hypothetical protein IPF52_18755 [Saprospiraceae bacterium]|nr:hypothetical protein [Saprospiraceae bacterium]
METICKTIKVGETNSPCDLKADFKYEINGLLLHAKDGHLPPNLHCDTPGNSGTTPQRKGRKLNTNTPKRRIQCLPDSYTSRYDGKQPAMCGNYL